MPHTLFYHQTAGVQCQNKLRGDTQICIAHCMHIYTHGYMALAVLAHICTSSHSGSSRRHLTRYAELLLESMLASQGTSVTAFLLLGQVTLQEARSGPKTATWYPAERAAYPRQRPASFTRPVTPQQCVGGFFYAMGEWNLSPAGSYWHLCGRWTGEGRGPAGEVEGVCVWSNKDSDELKDCWTLDFTTKEQNICTYDHVHAMQEKLLVKQHTLKGLL